MVVLRLTRLQLHDNTIVRLTDCLVIDKGDSKKWDLATSHHPVCVNMCMCMCRAGDNLLPVGVAEYVSTMYILRLSRRPN